MRDLERIDAGAIDKVIRNLRRFRSFAGVLDSLGAE